MEKRNTWWEEKKQQAKEIKQYLKGRFVEVGHTFTPPVQEYWGEEKYFGPAYKAKRKKRNKQAYRSRRINSKRRRKKY